MSIMQPVKRGPGRPRKGPSDQSIFVATHAPTAEIDTDIFESQETARADTDLSPIEIEHIRAGRVRLWLLTANGSVPRWVSNNGNHLQVALRNGMATNCHDCGGEHGEGINDCPGRPKRQYRPCPVCGKKMFDPKVTGATAKQDGRQVIGVDDDGAPILGTVERDPMAISNDDLGNSTPASRTTSLVRRHVGAFHKDDLDIYFPRARREVEEEL